MSKILKYAGIALAVLLAGAQFIRPERTNPPSDPKASFEMARPDPALLAVIRRACYDCHSNATVWPWYSGIAPVSWLVADDVEEGRARLNFSQWGLLTPEASHLRLEDACREATRRDMPPWYYSLVHPGARLSDEEIKILCGAAR